MKHFIQNNFTAFAVGSLTISMFSGWMCLSYIQNQQTKRQPALLQPASVLGDDDTHNTSSSRIKSREELRLKAMVENALHSTWKENLNNAVQAHERFMLPGRDHGTDPQFMKKIDRRCEELLIEQHKKQKRQQQNNSNSSDTEPDSNDEENENQEDKIQFWK